MPWRANHPRLSHTALYACLALALVILGFEFMALLPRVETPTDDFAAYWAVGRLAAQGRNPYAPQEILALEQSAGWRSSGALMVYYPPWALVALMPLGMLPYAAGRLVWLLAGLLLFVACVVVLWRLYEGPPQHGVLPLILLGTSAPALFALTEGQVSVLMLLGLSGFLYFQARGRWFLAGACLPLIAFKPQLPYLFWLVLLLWAIDRRCWALLLGGLLAGVVTTLPAMLLNPAVFGQYVLTVAHHPPDGGNTATLWALVQLALGRRLPALQFAALLPGATWLVWHWTCQRRSWDWANQLPLVLLMTLVTAPFAWIHDQSLLLVPAISVAAQLARVSDRRRAALAWALYLAANGLAVAAWPLWRFAQAAYYLWPLLGLAAYLALGRGRRPAPGDAALAPAAL